MKLRCRKYNEPQTTCLVETDDAEHAPDDYVHRQFKMKTGDVVFVEVEAPRFNQNLPSPGWVLWRVEALSSWAYVTVRSTLTAMDRELKHPGRGRKVFGPEDKSS